MQVNYKRSFILHRLPLILLTLVGWATLAALIFLVDPIMVKDFIFPNSYLFFYILVWACLLATCLTLGFSLKRSLLWSVGITFLAFLRLIQLANLATILLVMGLMTTVEYYWWTGAQLPKLATN
jgi:hypothetical protein